MVDQATQRMVVGASPAHTWDVLANFDEYRLWAHDLKSVDVRERDAEGRGVLVAFRAAAMGRSTSYTLRYDYAKAPEVLAWELVEGDLTRKLDGSYVLSAVDDEPDKTEVTYHLEVELVVPLPGFVKRRTKARIIQTALRQLRDYLER
jgi:Polyketide cyclase / dehydrase and lipid transport